MAQRKRDRKKNLILKEQSALFTQLQATPSLLPHLSPTFCPSFSPTSSLLSPLAPAERLTRADEKGSSVKGQCWAATPRMPAPVQSNKAGCPPVTGCLGGKKKNGLAAASLLICSLEPIGYFPTMGWSRFLKGKAPWDTSVNLKNNLCFILTFSNHLIMGERKVSVVMLFSHIVVVVQNDFSTDVITKWWVNSDSSASHCVSDSHFLWRLLGAMTNLRRWKYLAFWQL